MHRLFTQIVSMMESQFASVFRISQQFNQISISIQNDQNDENENIDDNMGVGDIERKQLERLQTQLTDTLIQVDDWLFYLQDIFSLNIMTLRRALVHHLLTEFIYPVLLEPLLKGNLWGNVHHDVSMENIPQIFDEDYSSQRDEASIGLVVSIIFLTKVCKD